MPDRFIETLSYTIGYNKAFKPKWLLGFLAVPCWLKALGICAEGFWIRADLLYEVWWLEGRLVGTISLVNVYTDLKACILANSRGIIKDVKRTHRHTHTDKEYFKNFMHTAMTFITCFQTPDRNMQRICAYFYLNEIFSDDHHD